MYVSRCDSKAPQDTICIHVKDTAGINWNLLSVTACTYLRQIGFTNQQIFILRFVPAVGIDTVAKKNCP